MTLESTQLAEALRSAATIDALRANPFRLANARVDSTSRELNRALNTLKVKVELGDEPGHTFAPDTADADMVRQAAERVKDPVKRLADETIKVLNAADVKARLAELGFDPVGNTPAEFSALVLAEQRKWVKLIQAAGIKPE